MPPSLVLLACVALLGAPLRAEAHRVDARGAPGTHREISAAVTAAGEGDTIVVQPGTYEQPVVVDGKSLTIVASGEAPLLVQPFVVRNLAHGQSVVLDGLRLEPDQLGPGLTVERCAGAVSVRDSTLSGPLVPAAAAAGLAVDCAAEVLLRRCTLRGSRAVGLDAGPGLRLLSGRVSAFDCDLEGGGGMVVGGSLHLAGGPGAELLGGELLLVGGSLRGGPGGDGRVPLGVSGGSRGGPGLVVRAGGPGRVWLVGLSPEGGAGGRAASLHPDGASGADALAPPGRVERLARGRAKRSTAGAAAPGAAVLGRHL